MTLLANRNSLRFCCGAVEIGNFRNDYTGYNTTLNTTLNNTNGFVFKIATFVNRPSQRKAYEEMCHRLKLVAQTEPKRNPNSGNLVFVAVFTNK